MYTQSMPFISDQLLLCGLQVVIIFPPFFLVLSTSSFNENVVVEFKYGEDAQFTAFSF